MSEADCLHVVTGRGRGQTHLCGKPASHVESTDGWERLHQCHYCTLRWGLNHQKVRTTCRGRDVGE